MIAMLASVNFADAAFGTSPWASTSVASRFLALSPGDFGKFIGEEIEKWPKVVKFSGAKAD
jgi:hypothetical protein